MEGMRETIQTVSQFVHDTFMVSIQLKAVMAAIVSLLIFFFGELYHDALVAVIMLMMFDTVLAVGAAYKNGEEISSRRFGRVVVKGFVYFSSISAGYFADLTVPFDAIEGTMIAFIGITEFISILENMGKLGYQTPKKLLNQLKEYRDNK